MMLYAAALLAGLVIMALAGHALISGASGFSRRLGIPPVVAGVLIIGFGTSAPEMLVTAQAGFAGTPDLAVGNIVGSNIANIFLVLAVPALLMPMMAGHYGERSALLVMLLATAAWIAVASLGLLSPLTGMIFLAALLLYLVYSLVSTRRAVMAGHVVMEDESGLPPARFGRSLILTLLGVVGLPLAAWLIIFGGAELAEEVGVPQEIIGLTLLAIGTSLPEIGAGLAAAVRRQGSLVFGNILGSNIFNLLGAGGIIALFGPIDVAPNFPQYSHWTLALAALLPALFILPRSRVSRLAAIALLLVYALYLYGLVEGWNILALFAGGEPAIGV